MSQDDEANVIGECTYPKQGQQENIWQFQVQNDVNASIRQ
jgi:hypothetical protein